MSGFGFIGPDGAKVLVPVRSHLGLPYVQEALRKSCGVRLTCLCGGGRLSAFRVPGFEPAVYDVRRESVDDPHELGCFAGELGFFFERAPVSYAQGAFDAPQAVPRARGVGIGTRSTHARYGSFTHWVYSLIGRASMQAFLRVNAGKTYADPDLAPFGMSAFDDALMRLVRTTSFSNGTALLEALRNDGRVIVWGPTSVPLLSSLESAKSCPSYIDLGLTSVRSTESAGIRRVAMRVSKDVASHTGIRCSAFGKPLGGPYWFCAVARQVNQIEGVDLLAACRIVVIPIATPTAPYAIESDFERSVVQDLLRKRVAILKPATHYALGELGQGFWPFGLRANGRLPNRPDVLIYSRGKCCVTELAGFTDDGYLKAVESRLNAMVSTMAHPAVHQLQLSLTDFEKGKRLEIP